MKGGRVKIKKRNKEAWEWGGGGDIRGWEDGEARREIEGGVTKRTEQGLALWAHP